MRVAPAAARGHAELRDALGVSDGLAAAPPAAPRSRRSSPWRRSAPPRRRGLPRPPPPAAHLSRPAGLGRGPGPPRTCRARPRRRGEERRLVRAAAGGICGSPGPGRAAAPGLAGPLAWSRGPGAAHASGRGGRRRAAAREALRGGAGAHFLPLCRRGWGAPGAQSRRRRAAYLRGRAGRRLGDIPARRGCARAAGASPGGTARSPRPRCRRWRRRCRALPSWPGTVPVRPLVRFRAAALAPVSERGPHRGLRLCASHSNLGRLNLE